MKKNKVIGLLATISCALALAGGLSVNEASATGKTVGNVDVSSFTMEEGASARFGAADGQNGIRFTAHMDEAKYKDLEKLETDTVKVNYGMLIVPTDIVTANGALTSASVFGKTDATYSTAADCDATDKATVCGTCGKVHIASITYEKMSDTNTSDGLVDLRGSLVGIKQKNINREMSGIAYIEYDNNGTKSYTFANDLVDNQRSMTYVAQVAIKQGNDDSSNTLYNTYVKPLEANKYQYTINHYLPTGTDGAYELKGTETLSGKLGDSVAATNIFKSTLEDRADFKDYAEYSFDTTKGVVSDILYANGRTVLNCYYQESDKVLWSAADPEDVAGMTTKNGATDYPESFDATNITEHGKYATTVASYTDGSGVTSGTAWKFTTTEAYGWGAGKFHMFLDGDKLTVAENANWDYLKVRMCVVIDRNMDNSDNVNLYAGMGTPLIGGTHSKGFAPNTWVDFIVPKAALNTVGNLGAYMMKKANVTAVQDKAGFDSVFRSFTTTTSKNDSYPMWFSDNVGPAKEGNDATAVDVVPTLTYYIETIEWGVDVEAPELTAVSAVRAGVSYRLVSTEVDVANNKAPGIFEFEDDIIPNLQHNLQNYVRPNFSAVIYKVENGARTEVTPNGELYTFEEGYDYEADVTIDDRAVTNVACNTHTETVKLMVLGDDDLDTSMFVSRSFDGTTTTTYEYATSYTDGSLATKDNVIKMTTRAWWDSAVIKKWGGYVYMDLGYTADEITALGEALADDAKDVILKLDVCVTKPVGAGANGTGAKIQSGSVNYAVTYNTWTSVAINVKDNTTANDRWATTYENKVTGVAPIFTLFEAWSGISEVSTDIADSELNIYLDSISITITDKA